VYAFECMLLKIKNLLMEWEFTEDRYIEQTLKVHWNEQIQKNPRSV